MLVLDANILIHEVLGSRVLSLLRRYADQVEFLAPDTAFEEAREWLPEVLERRQLPVSPALAVLDLAAALTFDCPIWTEDTDFFGCGVATWTTDRVEFYLEKAANREA